MADERSWTEAFLAVLDHPEKGALFLVILVGAWRWLRELWRERKEDDQHDTLLDRMFADDRALREENDRLRKENRDLLVELKAKTKADGENE